jgi:serine/threonine protein kinase
MDTDIDDVRPYRCLHLTAHRFIAIFQDKYILKLFDDDIDSVEKELRMMLLAGDCSVIPLGRVFKEGKLYGIIMPYETPVVPPSPDPTYTPLVSSELSRSDRLRIINQLRLLLSLLHAKGIIHGDIKPSNLLLCSDGELRFCDFGEAAVEDEGDIPRAMSVQYSSPFICRTIPLIPLTKAEDIYAAGISMWEIYTGRIPFDDVDEDMIEDVIKSGVRPDITLIDDAMVAKLVVSYLDSGDRSFYESMSPQAKETCIDTDTTLLRRSFDARCTLIPSPLPTPPPSPPSLRPPALSNDRNPFVRRPNDPRTRPSSRLPYRFVIDKPVSMHTNA